MNRCAAALLLASALVLGGCASTPPQTAALQQQWPEALPSRGLLTAQVPFFPQEDYECGPAALAMLMGAAGVAVTPAQLVPQVYLPGRLGSLPQELQAATRSHGLLPYRLAPSLPDVLQEVASGHPVLVFQNLGLDSYPVWHYAVLIGFDRERNEVRLHSGVTRELTMSLSVFERTWARAGHWAMVALPPSQLPTTAQPAPLAMAISALERQNMAAAAQAYELALQRWPRQPLLLLGLGNTAYGMGNMAKAEAALQAAVLADPQFADAWNNLAQLLFEQGRKDEARAAIAHAVALGGPRLPQYQELAQRLNS